MRKIGLGLLLVILMARFGFAQNIKTPNVSGQFYADDPQALAQSVETYLQAAHPQISSKTVKMIIAPHAGYVYSGPVAGYSFKSVQSLTPKTIIILAPSHYYGFAGASVWPDGGFQTPLGTISVDQDLAKALSAADPQFAFVKEAFDREHSLEVELPFLQKTYSDFKIVPVIVGQMSFELCQKLSDAVIKLIQNRKDILIVISSDMSHYHDGKTARAMDLGTLEIIKQLDAENLYRQCLLKLHEMCGFVPVTTALLIAQKQGWTSEILKYAHSGDVTGDNSRVVGYGAVAFVEKEQTAASGQGLKEHELSKEQKKYLLDLARTTITQFVKDNKTVSVKTPDPRLSQPEGAFVTIHKHSQLRGCIGHIVTQEPLVKTVRDMAIASASEDPRFDAVTADELPDLEIEISVLSVPRQIHDTNEIQMGTHGVIVSRGGRQGVFLPQVATETGWSKEKFMAELCSQKAGLPANCWKDPTTQILIFTAQVFSEQDVR